MAGITYIDGDATQPKGEGLKVIPHIVNDIGAWGAGFVVALSRRWPHVGEAYWDWFKGQLPGASPLMAPPFTLGQVQFVEAEAGIWIANMLAQHGTGPDEHGRAPIRYGALNEALERVAVFARELGATVHAPQFGAGLAGGDWPTIEGIIQEQLIDTGVETTVYLFPQRRVQTFTADERAEGRLFGGRKKAAP